MGPQHGGTACLTPTKSLDTTNALDTITANMISVAVAIEGISSPLMTLPNEIFFEMASHLESLKDFNSLLRTNRFFHTLFNAHLYRRAVAANEIVREAIVVWVLQNYRVRSLTFLLDNGLSVHQKLCADSITLLSWTCHLGDHNRAVLLAELLIERGADMQSKDAIFGTALHQAVISDNRPIAELLLAHGADANVTDERGRTPLHRVVTAGYHTFLGKALLDHGADINAITHHGRSALWLAFTWGNYGMCELLLDRGADTRGLRSSDMRVLLNLVEQWRKLGHCNQ
jgi:ankyrin repeat protein